MRCYILRHGAVFTLAILLTRGVKLREVDLRMCEIGTDSRKHCDILQACTGKPGIAQIHGIKDAILQHRLIPVCHRKERILETGTLKTGTPKTSITPLAAKPADIRELSLGKRNRIEIATIEMPSRYTQLIESRSNKTAAIEIKQFAASCKSFQFGLGDMPVGDCGTNRLMGSICVWHGEQAFSLSWIGDTPQGGNRNE